MTSAKDKSKAPDKFKYKFDHEIDQYVKRRNERKRRDIWLLGEILYFVWYGKHPFTSQNVVDVKSNDEKRRILRKEFHNDDKSVPEEVRSLIDNMIRVRIFLK